MTISVPRYCTLEQAERWAAVGLPLDRYGETPRFSCAVCASPTGLKVSVPVELAHCSECGSNTSDTDALRRLEREQGITGRRAGVEPIR